MLGHLHQNHNITSFLWYFKELAYLLFWVIWACLATNIQNNSITLNKPLTFICKQKINLILHVFLEILQTCFGYFGHTWLCKPKVTLLFCRKLSCLSAGEKLILSPMLFWRYYQDMETSYFEYLGHAWLHTLKLVLSTFGRLWYLSACQKTSSFTSFWRYYILKNPTIWLADSILVHNSGTRILPDIELVVKYQ